MTLRAADVLTALEQVSIVGVVYAAEAFAISYAPEGFENRQFAPMDEWAEGHGIASLRRDAGADLSGFVHDVSADIGLVIGWHHNLGADLLSALPRGAIGVHASLLPELRGHAPLPWAILTGRKSSGVSLFEIDAQRGVDEGRIFGRVAFPVSERATVGDLLDAAEDACAEVLAACLPALATGSLAPSEQIGQPSYGLRRSPADGQIDWTRPAAEVDRLVRAVTRPYPGARTVADAEEWFVWAVRPGEQPAVHGAPGQVALVAGAENPVVVTGDGWVELLDVTTADGEDRLAEARRWNHRRLGGQRA